MNTQTRRTFLKKSAATATMVCLMPGGMTAMMKASTGIQLYTVRDKMDSDVAGTLKMLADIGYREVEGAGYSDGKFYKKSPAEFLTLLRDNGLKMPSGHYTTGNTMPEAKGTLTNGWEKAVDDAGVVGQEYMVCAYLFDEERKSADDYKKLAELMNRCGETCRKGGVQFAYHNHDFEFKEIDGRLPYDILLKETDPGLVKMELDLFWATKAGHDPVALFKASPGRFPLWHIKDMNSAGEFTEVGTGTIDFKRIFAAKKTAGMKHFFIEQDQIKGDVRDSVVTSYTNLQKII